MLTNEYSLANSHQSLRVHHTSIYLQRFGLRGTFFGQFTILGTHNETSNTQVATFIQGMIASHTQIHNKSGVRTLNAIVQTYGRQTLEIESASRLRSSRLAPEFLV